MSESKPSRASSALVLLLVALVLVPFFLRLRLLEVRGFNPDELEHLHWSWCVSEGMVPYRDYFDHHTPWLHFLLASFFPLYDLERVPDEAIAFVFAARRLMWIFAGAVLALTLVLGWKWRDGRTGIVAAILLSHTAFFLSKSLEIRPAVPAAALLLLSVLLALSGFRRAASGKSGGAWRLLVSGLALGAATMFTQKILFVGPGFALVTFWFLVDPRLAPRFGARIGLALLQALGWMVPLGVTLAYFAKNEALGLFFDANWLINTRWPGLSAGPFLRELVETDGAFVILTIAGLAAAAAPSFGREGALRADPVLALPTLSLVATLPFHPAMSYQHFLLILPLASLYAGAALIAVASLFAGAVSKWVTASKRRLVVAILAGLLLALSVRPLARFRETFDRGNWGTLQAIDYVLRNTAPWETTLDGFTGLGMFRPQAFYHHFLYSHAYLLQSEAERGEMLEALEAGEASPKLVFWSHYLRDGVSPEMRAFVEEHYVPTGLEPILVRPFDNGAGWWKDDAVRYIGWVPEAGRKSPHVLFDDAWRPPATEFGMPVRRTRTRRSKLVVPLRYPRDFTAVFRAHAEPEETPFGVELVVNGHSAGVLEATPRWQDYAFPVTIRELRPGFNELELRFSAANDDARRRLELAVHSLQLVPAEREETSE